MLCTKRWSVSDGLGKWSKGALHSGQLEGERASIEKCTHQKQKVCPHALTVGLNSSSLQIGHVMSIWPASDFGAVLLSRAAISSRIADLSCARIAACMSPS